MGLMPTELEKEMISAAEAGKVFDRGGGPFSPEAMRAWGTDRTVRSCVLRSLLVGNDSVAAKGVRLRGIKIEGHLDLEAATVPCPLCLDSCYFDGPRPVFKFGAVSLLELKRCHLAGLAAEHGPGVLNMRDR